MGAVIRLTDDIDKWLKTIDGNPHKALRIIKTGYVSHKKLEDNIISKLEDIEQQIENLKQF